MRTSPVGWRSRGTRRQRVLAAAGALVITGAVAAPPLPATQAAGGGRREPVGHAGSQVAEAGPVAAGLSLATGFGTATGDLAGRAARAEAAAVQPGLLGALVPQPLAGQLPPPTRADSGGEAHAERTLAAPPAAGPASLAGARERAAATAEGASAVADLGTVTVAGALTASGSTVIVAHDVPLLLAACDHLAAMDLGRVIAASNPGDVVRHPDVIASYLGQQAPSLVGNTSPAAPAGM